MVEVITNFIQSMGIVNMDWRQLAMILVACLLLYLAISKGFEPLLLVPIAFGMLLSNLPLSGVMNGAVSVIEPIGATVNNTLEANITTKTAGGLLHYLFLGDELGIFPPLIFLGVGAMTDFGPLISNPKSILLGAAAQFGIFFTFIGALLLGFTGPEAASTGIIGGADGPTAIYLTTKLAPHLLAPIAVAAYSYMALVPIIQPPIMRALTSQEERGIVMTQSKPVSKKVKILFPITVTIVVSLLLPAAATLIGMLMFGNLLKECAVTDRLSDTASNALMNIVTIFLGLSVGASAKAEIFLSAQTLKIFVLGVIAFGIGTAAGVICAKIMNKFTKEKINPLIGAAGVSAVPMAARVAHKEAQKENPGNFILMHAMGPNVAGVIGSAVAAGILLSLFG
ncbi:sodium ion-translocating decarboxylase subunit beta [Clostridioides mangenotii]|uniref:sodium ion-translocating decarboxylase subunit beta n=1 Tax=Metaclostridioides mangenotii TaxID=1540 RepID=UPI002149EB8B|nr:sodium ion-translocating decarboxylase subunit beta [Clostridioides mangenotii]MCR1954696.1 sodium ion-translocating decarboxylase subunit beta [Clostridioides mangenotii]